MARPKKTAPAKAAPTKTAPAKRAPAQPAPRKRAPRKPAQEAPADLDWVALVDRGNNRQDEGDLDGAIADFSRAMELAPDELAPVFNRGNARSLSGDVKGAVADYTEAVRIQPDFAAGYERRGMSRQRLGDLEGALGDLNTALELNPDNPTAFGERAAVRALRGDIEGAVVDCEHALEIAPKDWKHLPNTRHLLDTLRAALGNAEEKKSEKKARKAASGRSKKAKESAPPDDQAIVEQVLTEAGFTFERVEEDDGSINYVSPVVDGSLVCATVLRYSKPLERLVFYVIFGPKAKKAQRAELAEFLTRANWGLGDGNFEMDWDTGEVRFKVALDHTGTELSPLLVRNIILDALDNTEVYQEALGLVISGKVRAKVALRRAEQAMTQEEAP
jgi:hypothetical protein